MARVALLALLVLGLALSTSARRPPPRRFPPPRPPPPSPRPPSPSPPPPPPPPPTFYEYPHNCNPGNARPNGQDAGVDCTPFEIPDGGLDITGRTVTFPITAKGIDGTCTAVRGRNCGTMLLNDIKFAVNTRCWNTVAQSITVTDSRGSYTRSPVWARETYPISRTAGMTFRVVFTSPYTAANVTGLRVSFSLNPNAPNGCNNPNTFFNTGKGFSGVQYGYFSPDKVCCGQEVIMF